MTENTTTTGKYYTTLLEMKCKLVRFFIVFMYFLKLELQDFSFKRALLG
jgi:hypothetical protein